MATENVTAGGLRFEPKDQNEFWEHLFKKNLVRLGPRELFLRRKEELQQIAETVKCGRFQPNIHGFLSCAKGKGVARFVPVFDYRTYAVYFACVRAIDELCADVAVDDTFGGWSLGGKRRRHEEQVIRRHIAAEPKLPGIEAEAGIVVPRMKSLSQSVQEEELEEDDVPDDVISMPTSSYNKRAWFQNWQQFWIVLATTTEQIPDDSLVVSFDVANFYDSLDLDLLERRLYAVASREADSMTVLLHLLRHWNVAQRFYKPSSKGVPMDMVGDMSRVLANYYLVEFDKAMNGLVKGKGSKYIRWSDDMTFTCNSKEVAVDLLYSACESLHKLGLNVNKSKVNVRPKREFTKSWGFEIMDKFEQDDQLEYGLLLLKERYGDPDFERRETALRRSLSLLEKRPDLAEHRLWVYETALSVPEFALRLTHGQLHALMTISDNPPQAAADLEETIMSSPFTEPKTHLLRCLERKRNEQDSSFRKVHERVRDSLRESGDPVLVLAATHSHYEGQTP